jgi:hypothetical protein
LNVHGELLLPLPENFTKPRLRLRARRVLALIYEGACRNVSQKRVRAVET